MRSGPIWQRPINHQGLGAINICDPHPTAIKVRRTDELLDIRSLRVFLTPTHRVLLTQAEHGNGFIGFAGCVVVGSRAGPWVGENREEPEAREE